MTINTNDSNLMRKPVTIIVPFKGFKIGRNYKSPAGIIDKVKVKMSIELSK
jgi:hypothetical protein